MATRLTRWGNTVLEQLNGLKVTQTAIREDQVAIADNAGELFGVAYRQTSAAGATSIWLKVHDTAGGLGDQGLLRIDDGGLGPRMVTGPAVGASGDGFAVVFQSSADAAAPADLKVRYVGAVGLAGAEVAVHAATGNNEHDAAVAGFERFNELADKTVGRTLESTGFDVAWISSTPSAADARYGAVMMQRFVLNAADPAGEPTAAGPVLAGRDGLAGGTDTAPETYSAFGRSVSMATLHDGESVVAWIEAVDPGNPHGAQVVRFKLRDADGGDDVSVNGVPNLNDLFPPGVADKGTVKVAAITGTTDFVIAWVTTVAGVDHIVGQIFTAGAAANTWDVTLAPDFDWPVVTSGPSERFTGDFSIAGLGEGETSFVLSYGVTKNDQGTTDAADDLVEVRSVAFTAGGAPVGDQRVFDVQGADAFASAGLLGDRAVVVGAGANGDVTAQFLDTRDQPTEPMIGDRHRADGRVDARPDIMVGTNFNDDIRPGLAADVVYAGIGDDLIEGSVGSDAIHGGDGTDTVTYTGPRSQYTVVQNADGSVSVAHNGGNEGPDTLWDIERIRFGDGTELVIAQDVPPRDDTPSDWGNTNADLHGFAIDAAVQNQTRPAIADNFGEFFGVAYLAGSGADAQIRLQLYKQDGSPDEFLPLPMRVDQGAGAEINASTGVAIVGWGDGYDVVWGETTDAGVRLTSRFLGPESIIGDEIRLGDPQHVPTGVVKIDQHSVSMFGYEKVVEFDADGKPLTVKTGFNAIWVETDRAASDPPAGSHAVGEVVFQRYEVQTTPDGLSFLAPKPAGRDGEAEIGNDAPQPLGIGRDPHVTVLHDGETLISWIEEGATASAPDVLRLRLLDPNGDEIQGVALPDGSAVANGQLARVAGLGAGNFGVFWIAENDNGDLVVRGQTFVLGGGPGAFIAGDIVQVGGPLQGFTGEFNVSGLGEDNDGGVITYSVTVGGETAIMAQNFDGTGNGFGNPAVVDGPGGTETGHGVAALISDRAVVVWNDVTTNPSDSNIRVQIIDTREGGQEIFGDLVRPDGTTQERRDQIVGTVHDDLINSLGHDDTVQAGMGNDIVIGGSGNDHLDGGEERLGDQPGQGTDIDVAVFSGERQQYSVTVNGDGSFTVKDMRTPRSPDSVNAGPDGRDVIANFEEIKFASGPNVDMGLFFGSGGTDLPLPDPSFDGTPRPWGPRANTGDFTVNDGVSDPATGNPIADSTAGIQHAPLAVAMQDNYAFLWQQEDAGGNSHLYLKAYNSLGLPDNTFGIGPVADPVILRHEVGDGAGRIAKVAATMAGDLGVVAAWEETPVAGGASAVKLTFVSSLDGPLGGEVTVASHGGAQSGPAVSGYETLVNNRTAEFGFNVVWSEARSGGSDIYIERFVIQGATPPEHAPVSQGAWDIGDGTGASATTLHDGQLVVSWIDGASVHVKVLHPDSATPSVAPTLLAETTIPGTVSHQEVVGIGFNFVLVRQVGHDVFATIYNAAGAEIGALSEPLVLPDGATFQVSPTAAEQGFAIYWAGPNDTQVHGQVYDSAGAAIGRPFDVFTDGDTTLAGAGPDADGSGQPDFSFSVAGLEDGRLIVTAEGRANADGETNDIVGQVLDTRQPGTLIMGDREGAPRDVLVGTSGNDIIDGRVQDDELHGADGDDVIMGGSENDALFGDSGNDILIGGSEDDTLDGGDGDDLLLGGFGQDAMDGGSGNNTVSYRGEFARFRIDLQSDPANPAVGATFSNRNPDTGGPNAGGAFLLEDTLLNIANAIGGEDDDAIFGTAGNNVLEGRGGNDLIDGRGGDRDTVVFSGNRADYAVTQNPDGSLVIRGTRGDGVLDGEDTVINVERFSFADGELTADQLLRTNGGGTGPGTPGIRITPSPVAENAPNAVVASLEGQDLPGSGAVAFALVTNPGNLFVVVSSEVRVAPGKTLDFETGAVHNLVVTASRGGTTVTGTLRVDVTDVNEAPTDITAAGLSVTENAGGGTVVATLSSNDPDRNDPGTYGLSGPDAALFTVVGNEIRVAAGAVIDYEGSAIKTRSVTVTLTDAAGHTVSETMSIAVQNVAGTFTGTGNGETINGTSEEDTIRAAGGGDTVNGFAGDDQIFGDSGNDTLNGNDGNDLLDGGAGRDTMDGGAGADRMVGGSDNDTYVVDNAGDTVVEASGAGTDTVQTTLTSYTLSANVENLTFTGAGGFTGVGNTLNNVIAGNGGNDDLSGGAGSDTVNGNGGDDVFRASVGDGSDTYNGGAGSDTYSLAGTTANGTINLQTGNASSGQTGSDRLVSIENATGGAGSDTLIASTVRNVFAGGAGGDTFRFDTVAAAGSGATRDVITDFVRGVDRIDLRGIDADTTAGGDQAFNQVAASTTPFSDERQLRTSIEKIDGVDYTIVRGNVGGSLAPDFEIAILGQHNLTTNDFLL